MYPGLGPVDGHRLGGPEFGRSHQLEVAETVTVEAWEPHVTGKSRDQESLVFLAATFPFVGKRFPWLDVVGAGGLGARWAFCAAFKMSRATRTVDYNISCVLASSVAAAWLY